MRIALAQMHMTDSREENLRASLEYIGAAKRAGADLVLFPEVQLSPFFAQYPGKEREPFAMTMEDPCVQKILEACRREKIWASPNFYLKQDGKYFDTSLLVDDRGEIAGRQTMVHIAQAPCFYEKDYYTPSEDGFHVFATPFGKIGIVICFDRHYPESIRTEALLGADLVLIPTANTDAEPEEMFQWEVRVQAFQNSVFAAMANRTGREGNMTFDGLSLVCGPDGELLALGGREKELVLADLDLSRAGARRQAKPYTDLRRPEWYQ
ncbi:MAG: carbon-nitrogen hydrolase family protein [Lachnospiraceae bacterium]